jgi:aminopeptidase N
VVANGVLVSTRHHPPSHEFPAGSVTWNWHSAAPVASYLVENSIGNYTLTAHTAGGITIYRAQDASIGAAQQQRNLKVMRMQRDIIRFESRFTGAYPFTSDGIIIGMPPTSFDEEMQTMIAFSGGQIDTDTLYHENMHQWWGDNVSESGYRMTFFKEGMATLGEFLYQARLAQNAAGGPSSPAGRAAFQASLVEQVNSIYGRGGSFWTVAPSNPDPYGLFSGASTYFRPGAAYIALRQILGPANFIRALRQIQRVYGGSSISEPQLEAAFQRWLPAHTRAAHARLSRFFTQWFDTAYPAGGGTHRPTITGPGLAGPGFAGALTPGRVRPPSSASARRVRG